MAEGREYNVRQIVWAKVANYPWWPARIIKSLSQHKRNIYKVIFFGDSTYCFLEPSALLQFESGLQEMQNQAQAEGILKKPIQLAISAFRKSKSDCPDALNAKDSCLQISPSADMFDETKLQQKVSMENVEKAHQISQLQPVPSVSQHPIQIQQSNVIDVLEYPMLKQLRSCKGYTNRKQAIAMEQKIKQTLLKKYQLFNLPKPAQNIQKPIISKRKLIVKGKKHDHEIYRLSAKKLYCIIRKYYEISSQSSQHYSQRIVSKLQTRCHNNRKQFAREYVKVVSLVQQNRHSLESIISGICFDRENYQRNFSMEEEFKKQEDEKSKITQIGVEIQ